MARRGRSGGFTLVELLVVLAIVAGLAALVAPEYPVLYARMRAVFEQADLERQLLQLPRRVRDSRRGGALTARSGDNLPDGTLLPVEDVPKGGADVEHWQVLRLDLPGGWRLSMPHPVFYHFTGACDGGEVAFVLPPVALHYRLVPPLCRPIAVPEAH